MAKKGSSLQNGPMDQLLIPRAKQKTEISNYFQTKWSKVWKSYEQARQTKIWFPKPNLKKSQQLLNMSRNTLGKLVQFLTGHNNTANKITVNITGFTSVRILTVLSLHFLHSSNVCSDPL